jgi:hypothetical protein
MIRLLRNLLIIYLCFFLYAYSTAQVFADLTLDETKELLKKSLTIVELDQEIARLSTQDTQVTAQIDTTMANLVKQDQQVHATREHAGKVLRAYYMGERESIWILLFKAKSFADAIALYEYLSMIITSDHMLLNSYAESLNELKNLQSQLLQTQSQLREVKTAFIAQRDRNIALQKEVDARLKLIPKEQAQVIISQIDVLKATFKDKVVPLFKKYFAGISKVMPDFVEHAINKERDKYIVGTTFQVSDQDLTQFFREHDKLFENLTFQFQNGKYSVVGVDGDIKASIKGHYTVEENPNRLQFHVDELGYNDNVLDETTKRYMEETFDLSLSVENHTQGLLQAEEITTENGFLTLKMKILLKPKEN